MKKRLFLLIILICVLLLTACREGTQTTQPGGQPQAGSDDYQPRIPAPPIENDYRAEYEDDYDYEEDILDPYHPSYQLHKALQRFPKSIGLSNEPIRGGELIVGHVSTNPPPSVFNAIFSSSADEIEIMTWAGINSSVFSATPEHQFGQYGLVNFEFCLEYQTFTLTQTEPAFWHDGTPLTLDDLVFALEMIATPGYAAAGGIHWTALQQRIVGATEFHNGEASEITGLQLSYDKMELIIHFTEFPPSILFFGFWSIPYPRHIFENVPINEQPTHYRSTELPIGWGPFVFQEIIPYEDIILHAFHDYPLGRPYLDKVIIRILEPESINHAVLNEEVDLIRNFPLTLYSYFYDIPHYYRWLGEVSSFYNWIAFNLGTWDSETGRISLHEYEYARMGNIYLRRAMAYAVNELELTSGLFENLRFPATSIIPPSHGSFFNPYHEGFGYNPDFARVLLDEAGFIDIDGDGFREFPDGDELILNFVVANEQSPNQQFIVNFYADAWAAVGLNINIVWVDWIEKVASMFNADDWDWDITTASWHVGTNPNPNSMWGHTPNNRARFMNEFMEEHLLGFNFQIGWDTELLTEHYTEWQRIFSYYVPAFPTNWRIILHAVSSRVCSISFDVYPDGVRTYGGLHRISMR